MGRKSKYTKELLGPIVASSKSLAEVLRVLGLAPAGGNHRLLRTRIRLLGLDTSHMGRVSWSKGKTKETDPRLAEIAQKRLTSDDEVFVENSAFINGVLLKKRLIKRGWKYICSNCGLLPEWDGKTLVLQLDHINGICNDNRFENLRFLCPNCHTQTDTWSNTNPNKTPRICVGCQGPIASGRHSRCRSCGDRERERKYRAGELPPRVRARKIEWPPLENLFKMLEESNYSALAHQLGVSDNAIRSHINRQQAKKNSTGP